MDFFIGFLLWLMNVKKDIFPTTCPRSRENRRLIGGGGGGGNFFARGKYIPRACCAGSVENGFAGREHYYNVENCLNLDTPD